MADYYDMNTATEECLKNAQPTPCELAVENDKLKQKVAALCKERDEAHRQINQLVIRLNDETENLERLEKERDAAIADLKVNWLCAVCKNKTNESENEWAGCEKERPIHLGLGKKGVTCANFEWRGVGED